MNAIQDKYGRTITYLRLAVTDKCNMRCQYCLPEKGVKFLPRRELLTYEELLRLCQILQEAGIDKIRLTGGEPFLRKDIMHFIRELIKFFPPEHIHITTNGTYIYPYLEELNTLGVRKINLSLDTLNPDHFKKITRTDYYDQVMECFRKMLSLGFQLKVNTVVLQDKNTDDLKDLAYLTLEHSVEVRFIEEMPFNGYGKDYQDWNWNHQNIEKHLKAEIKGFHPLEGHTDTAILYKIDGATGTIGIIPSWTRTICGQCNRMRITPEGRLRTCLYDDGVFNLKDLIRNGASDLEIYDAIAEAFRFKAKDGFEAQQKRKGDAIVTESMATIGG